MSELLAAGAEVEATNEFGETPLMWAAENGHTGCVAVLLAAGVDVEATDKEGGTALVAAAEHGHKACVALLRAAAKLASTA